MIHPRSGCAAPSRQSWKVKNAARFASTWPLPALLSWMASWGSYRGLIQFGVAPAIAALIAIGLGSVLALSGTTRWRRAFIAGGFPVSLIAGGTLMGWTSLLWLVPLALLLLLYPLASWRDAPLFPTPAGALRGLAELAPLPPGACIVDAGCGLGAGLVELKAAYPGVRIVGLEWSWPLTWICRMRNRFAEVLRADIWAADWSAYDMVYLFQRPESMARAVAKASAEMRPGSWLVSLEFEAGELQPQARFEVVAGKPVWLYRAPFAADAAAGRPDMAATEPVRAPVVTNSATSSATGASHRKGHAKAPISVT